MVQTIATRTGIALTLIGLLMCSSVVAQDDHWRADGLIRDDPFELRVVVEGMTDYSSVIGLDRERVLDYVEGELRNAGVDVIDPATLVLGGGYLYVNVNVQENAASIDVDFIRYGTFDVDGQPYETSVSTWQGGIVGGWSTRSLSTDEYVMSGVEVVVGDFVADYVVANPILQSQTSGAADDDFSGAGDLVPLDPTMAEPRPLLAPGRLEARLGDESISIQGRAVDLYELQGLVAGEALTITMESASVDTYLVVVSPKTGAVLDENDDFSGSLRKSVVEVTVPASGIIWIAATSYSGTDFGPYELTVQTARPTN